MKHRHKLLRDCVASLCAEPKREGPCSSAEGLEFVGALIRGEEATIDPERVSASVAFLSAFERAGTCEFCSL